MTIQDLSSGQALTCPTVELCVAAEQGQAANGRDIGPFGLVIPGDSVSSHASERPLSALLQGHISETEL